MQLTLLRGSRLVRGLMVSFLIASLLSMVAFAHDELAQASAAVEAYVAQAKTDTSLATDDATSELAQSRETSSSSLTSSFSRATSASGAYRPLPLGFEAVRNGTRSDVRYQARGQGFSLNLLDDGAVLKLLQPKAALSPQCQKNPKNPACYREIRNNRAASHAVNLKMEFLGANKGSSLQAENQLSSLTNIYQGANPTYWTQQQARYGLVRYRQVYPGIDLVFYATPQGQFEYDFEVAPGADPGNIEFRLAGADRLRLDNDGNLVVEFDKTKLTQKAPRLYQMINGARQIVNGKYILKGRQVSFQVGKYDHSKPLVIDPTIDYSAYIGGTATEGVWRISVATDSAGNAYMTGMTTSADLGSTNGRTYNGGEDIFVSKIKPDGTLAWSTYLGGTGNDEVANLVAGSNGILYVVGSSASNNLPLASNTWQGDWDGFVARLNTSDGTLNSTTYLGGSSTDALYGVALDSTNRVYVTGYTYSTNMPTAGSPVLQPANGGSYDAIVARLNGTTLEYATYLGGAGDDFGYAVSVDSSNQAYVALSSTSATLAGQANQGGYDALVVRLSSTGSSVNYSTTLSGAGEEEPIALHLQGNTDLYVSGYTNSAGLASAGAAQVVKGADYDGFVARYTNLATTPTRSYYTYLGGSGTDEMVEGVVADASNNLYLSGNTNGTVAVTNGTTYGGGAYDAFMFSLNPAGSAFGFGTYLGGSGAERAHSIALAGSKLYVSGYTCSAKSGPGSFASVNLLGPGGRTASTDGYFAGTSTPDCDAFLTRLDFSVPIVLADKVNTASDVVVATDGQCSLREAINSVVLNANSGSVTGECKAGMGGSGLIQFDTAGVFSTAQIITLDPAVLRDLKITGGTVVIDGPGGSNGITIARDTGLNFRLLTVSNTGTNLTLNNLTLTGGNIGSTGSGGAVLINANTTVTINNSTISTNIANTGGGLSNSGTLTLNNSTVSGNAANNGSNARGGGVYNNGGTTNLNNSTITSNTAGSNANGRGLYNNNGIVNLKNSIVAANNVVGGVDLGHAVGKSFTSQGYNLIGNKDATTLTSTTGDQIGTSAAAINPLLNVLASNGGPTQTHALQATSPALNAGDPAYTGPLTTDQRGTGFARVKNSRLDIGAYEL